MGSAENKALQLSLLVQEGNIPEEQEVDVGVEKGQTVNYDKPLAVDVRVKHAAFLPRQHF